MVEVAIVGGSGYAGGELVRLLMGHPEVTIKYVTSERNAGKFVRSEHPNLRNRSDLKVTAINVRTVDTPLWRDTFVLTGKTGDSFTFQTHFTDFTGKFVQHCHVLTHEDLGMMETVEVIP